MPQPHLKNVSPAATGRMSRYRMCILLKSTFWSGSDQMRKNRICTGFVFTRVHQISIWVRCEQKNLMFCASINAACVNENILQSFKSESELCIKLSQKKEWTLFAVTSTWNISILQPTCWSFCVGLNENTNLLCILIQILLDCRDFNITVFLKTWDKTCQPIVTAIRFKNFNVFDVWELIIECI